MKYFLTIILIILLRQNITYSEDIVKECVKDKEELFYPVNDLDFPVEKVFLKLPEKMIKESKTWYLNYWVRHEILQNPIRRQNIDLDLCMYKKIKKYRGLISTRKFKDNKFVHIFAQFLDIDNNEALKYLRTSQTDDVFYPENQKMFEVFIYNPQGLLIQYKKPFFTKGKVSHITWQFFYDDKNRICEYKRNDLNENHLSKSFQVYKIQFSYDDEKKILTQYNYVNKIINIYKFPSKFISEAFSIPKKIIKEYNENNKLKKLTLNNSKDNFEIYRFPIHIPNDNYGYSSVEYKYDQDGNIIEERFYDKNGKLRKNGHAFIKRLFKKSLLLKKEYIDINNKVLTYLEYYYDDKNRLIKIIPQSRKREYNYKYYDYNIKLPEYKEIYGFEDVQINSIERFSNNTYLHYIEFKNKNNGNLLRVDLIHFNILHISYFPNVVIERDIYKFKLMPKYLMKNMILSREVKTKVTVYGGDSILSVSIDENGSYSTSKMYDQYLIERRKSEQETG